MLVVLVVATMLSLAAYTFSELMVIESRASRQFARDAQARELAASAIDYVAAQIGAPEVELGQLPNFYHNPGLFAGVPVVLSDIPEGQGWFTVVAPAENLSGHGLRFGLMNESARLNLSTLLNHDLDEETQRAMLLALPGMTDEIADAILDWIDSDLEPRAFGAESDYYAALAPPYACTDGPPESIDELLLVRDVTAELLYGEDANRNGLLDPNENDGDLSPPVDNADGVLDHGWHVYFTTDSGESNLRPDETGKIDVNQALLTELYDQIESEFGADLALFITAYRLYGASNVEPLDLTTSANDNTTGDIDTDTALQNLATSIAKSITSGQEGTVTRGGLDLSQGATADVQSLFEFLGAEIDAQIDGQPAKIVSPFGADAESLKLLFENFSTTSSTRILGRININEAREEVLLTIPYMEPELAAAIVAARPLTSDGAPIDDLLSQRTNTGWLLLEGLADTTQMRMIDAFVTCGGDVYRMQAVGRFTGAGPASRVEAVIDASGDLPKVVFRRDLGELRPGYRLEQLQPTAQSQ